MINLQECLRICSILRLTTGLLLVRVHLILVFRPQASGIDHDTWIFTPSVTDSKFNETM